MRSKDRVVAIVTVGKTNFTNDSVAKVQVLVAKVTINKESVLVVGSITKRIAAVNPSDSFITMANQVGVNEVILVKKPTKNVDYEPSENSHLVNQQRVTVSVDRNGETVLVMLGYFQGNVAIFVRKMIA